MMMLKKEMGSGCPFDKTDIDIIEEYRENLRKIMHKYENPSDELDYLQFMALALKSVILKVNS